MAMHEFGIMREIPKAGCRYDEYVPEKYDCIFIDDDIVEVFANGLLDVDMHWHTIDVTGKGLAYCGITLIPPTSLGSVIDVIDGFDELLELRELLKQAQQQNLNVIHFDI